MTKWLQEATEIEPYRGLEKDHRIPPVFIQEFEDIILNYARSDKDAGRMFFSLLKKSSHCENWFRIIDKDMGYEVMKKTFLKHEWKISHHQKVNDMFLASNKNNSKLNNYGVWYRQWVSKLRHTHYVPEFVLQHLRNNLPDPVRREFDALKIENLEKFEEWILEVCPESLDWFDPLNPNPIKNSTRSESSNKKPSTEPVKKTFSKPGFFKPKSTTPPSTKVHQVTNDASQPDKEDENEEEEESDQEKVTCEDCMDESSPVN